MTRLLFTGGGGASSGALHRLLRDRYDVHFADADPDARPHGVPADAWHVIPPASSQGFVGALQRLCAEVGVDVLVPGVDEELPLVAQARVGFSCDILLPSAAFVTTHLDKLASNRALAARGIPVPVTETLAQRANVRFPCVVKPRRGRGSRHVAVVGSDDELRAHVVSCRRPATDFIVQERLQGQEYTVTIVADRRGVLRAVVPVRVELKRGITLRAETDRDAVVTAACASIHAASPIAGCFNIQLVKTGAGEAKPFEINPRVSTTTCLAIAAGVDVVDRYLDDGRAVVEGQSGLAPFEDRLRLKRSWHNEFLRAR